jgi:hypothetical protein
MGKEKFQFQLRGKTLVCIDWANVYGWSKKLKWSIDSKKLYDYLKTYPEIYDIRFYFGVEKGNIKSEGFQEEIKRIGYNLISKEVKWIPILFSGDGDYKAIVEYLLDIQKQVIIVHPFGLRGREYNDLLLRTSNRPYFCAVEKLTPFLKKIFPSKPKSTRA